MGLKPGSSFMLCVAFWLQASPFSVPAGISGSGCPFDFTIARHIVVPLQLEGSFNLGISLDLALQVLPSGGFVVSCTVPLH